MARPKISIEPLLDRVPSKEILENRFCFVIDTILRENLSYALKHIIFLSLLSTDLNLPESILFLIYKDIIINTASIVEASLNYSLRNLILAKKIDEKDIMPLELKYKNPKLLYKISNTKSICGITQHIIPEKFTNTTQFKSINKACLKAKIINSEIFHDVEKVRSMRNHIHLASLKSSESYYTNEDINAVFKITNKVLIQLEKILQ